MTPTPDPVAEAFGRLAARLEPEGSWCQEVFAKTKGGTGVSANSPQACSWCLLGALIADRPSDHVDIVVRDYLRQATGKSVWLDSWNDEPGRTHQQVLDLVAAGLAAYLAGR